MAEHMYYPDLPCWCGGQPAFGIPHKLEEHRALLTPSADMPACRDEDPAYAAALDACYPPDYAHPEDDDDGGAFDMAPGRGGWGG